MKKYIRAMLDDLKQKSPPPPIPEDLSNQELSDDPLEKVRQLDFQAQQDEERESGS